MAAWAGFSEEELQRLKHNGDLINQAVSVTLGRGRRAAPTNWSRQQLQRERALQLAAKQKEGSHSLPPDQQLTKPPDPPAVTPPAPVKSQDESNPLETQLVKHEAEPVKHDPESPAESAPPAVIKELGKEEVELREKNHLQQLQWEQRIMEEKNKKRKALLTKTIAEKSKQTQAEAVKLKKIQRELQLLDDSVSSDIGILRKLIEQSSMDYSQAWKRFEKAEAEYVARGGRLKYEQRQFHYRTKDQPRRSGEQSNRCFCRWAKLASKHHQFNRGCMTVYITLATSFRNCECRTIQQSCIL